MTPLPAGSQPTPPLRPLSAPKSGRALVGDSASPTDRTRLLERDRRAFPRYSRLVGLAKLILPLVAGGLILALAAWPYLSYSLQGLKAALPRFDIANLRDIRMVNARYTGVDKDKRPFTVTAETARQMPGSDDLVAMDVPKTNVLTQEGAWIVITGKTGMYQPQAHFLDLLSGVTLFHDKGYQFETNSVRVDLNTNQAEGHEPIHGVGPAGNIWGEGFQILEKGDTVLFTGKSKLIMNTAHARTP